MIITKFINHFDKLILSFGLALLILIILFVDYSKEWVILLVPISIITSYILYYLLSESPTYSRPENPVETNNTKEKLGTTLFFIFFAISIVSFAIRPEEYARPFLYYLCVMVMILITSYQLLSNHNSNQVLFKIILLSFNLAFSQFMLFPGIIGQDASYFGGLVKMTVVEGTLVGLSYRFTPLFIYLQSLSMITLGLDYPVVKILVGIPVQIIMLTIMVFIISRKVFKNHSVALLACLFTMIIPEVMANNIRASPFTFATLYILVTYWFLLESPIISRRTYGIIMTMVVATLLTHNIAIIFLTMIIGSFYVFNQLLDKTMRYPLNPIILMGVLVGAFWAYFGNQASRLAMFFNLGFSEEIFQGTGISLSFNFIRPFDIFLGYSVPFVLAIFSITGLTLILKRMESRKLRMFAIVTIGLFSMTALQLLLPIDFVMDRWFYYSFIIMAILAAYAIIVANVKWKKRSSITALTMVLILLLSSVSILGNSVSDEGLFENRFQPRQALELNEIQSLKTISHNRGDRLASDYFYFDRNVMTYFDIRFNRVSIDQEIHTGDFSETKADTIVIRDHIKNNTFRLDKKSYRLDYDPNDNLRIQGFGVTYSSDYVTAYRR